MIKKPSKVASHSSEDSIEFGKDIWIRQFIKNFEFNLLKAARDLPTEAQAFESRQAAARAILATFVDTGMELESVLELVGQVAIERQVGGEGWSEDLNQRRFELIDKEIQGTITRAERLELAGLTKTMRDNVETELNLPMQGARALHKKLLQSEASDETD